MRINWEVSTLFSSRAEAKYVLNALEKIANSDGFVTVDKLYELCMQPIPASLPKQCGWTRRELLFACIRPYRYKEVLYVYKLVLPCPTDKSPMSSIKRIITNGPATIVFFMDGTKTVVKRKETDQDDLETAIGMAVLKHLGLLNIVRKEAKKVEKERKELEDSERTGD